MTLPPPLPTDPLVRVVLAVLVLATLTVLLGVTVLSVVDERNLSAISILLIGVVIAFLVFGLTAMTGVSAWPDVRRGTRLMRGEDVDDGRGT